ncbi:MAG TPA: hypothetical protein H9683_06830 [Firmicutes bacterium]|nr:hypothetical protein [Bacillota bacterium]
MSIAYYHNEGREYNEEIIPEDFQPVPLVPLDEETEAAIIRTYLEEYSKEASIVSYMGTYGRCAIVRMYNLPYVVLQFGTLLSAEYALFIPIGYQQVYG